jgi:hypothetical protein
MLGKVDSDSVSIAGDEQAQQVWHVRHVADHDNRSRFSG